MQGRLRQEPRGLRTNGLLRKIRITIQKLKGTQAMHTGERNLRPQLTSVFIGFGTRWGLMSRKVVCDSRSQLHSCSIVWNNILPLHRYEMHYCSAMQRLEDLLWNLRQLDHTSARRSAPSTNGAFCCMISRRVSVHLVHRLRHSTSL